MRQGKKPEEEWSSSCFSDIEIVQQLPFAFLYQWCKRQGNY